MQQNELFKKYRSQLVREGVLKSFLYGLIAFSAVNFVVALIVWLCGMAGGVWLALGLGAGAGIATGLCLYFFQFKPNEKDVARRVDALGLEERTVTMLDYSDDVSYIALRQRDDAQRALRAASNVKLAIQLSVALIVPACVVPVVSAGMSTVTALAEAGIIPPASEVFNPSNEKYIELTYMVDGDGEIEGEDLQLLLPGEIPTPVKAVAADGWEFVGWDDNVKDPYRADTSVAESTIYTAIFTELPDDENGDGDKGDAGDEGDGDADPNDPTDSEGNGSGGEGDGSGETSEGTGSGKGDGQDNEGSDQSSGQGNGAGFKYDEKNQILDGDTYYGDELENYIRKLEEKLSNNEDITEEERRFIELYFGSL